MDPEGGEVGEGFFGGVVVFEKGLPVGDEFLGRGLVEEEVELGEVVGVLGEVLEGEGGVLEGGWGE